MKFKVSSYLKDQGEHYKTFGYNYLKSHYNQGLFCGDSIVGRMEISIIDLQKFKPLKGNHYDSFNNFLEHLKQTQNSIVFINYLEVMPDYQGNYIAKEIIKELKNNYPDIKIFLYPFPLQHLKEITSNFLQDFKKLYAYYESLGLKKVPDHTPYLECP